MNWARDPDGRPGVWSFLRCSLPSKYLCKKAEGNAPMCPGGFVEGAGSCWQLADKTQLNFDDARKYCRGQQSYLAEILGDEEQEFINSIIPENLTPWIGLQYDDDHGDYHWVSTDEDLGYSTFWGLNQPDESQKCVKIAAGEWYTDDCENYQNYPLCQTGLGKAFIFHHMFEARILYLQI